MCFPECENKDLSNVPGKNWNDIEVPAETSKTFDGEYCAKVNDPYDLADIITNRRIVLSFSCIDISIFDKTLLSIR